MPRTKRPSKKSRGETFARLVHDRFLASSESRADREKAWDQNYHRAHPSYVDPRLPEPRVKYGTIYRNIRTKHSWLIRNVRSSGRWARVYSPNSAAGDIGEVVSDAIEASFNDRTLGNPKSMLRGSRKALKYGDQYWLERWIEDENHQGSQTLNLNIDDVFPDYWGGKWYVLRRHVTLSELKRLAATLSRPVLEEQENPETGEMELVPKLHPNGKPVLEDDGVADAAFRKVLKTAKDGTFPDRYGWHWVHASKVEDRPAKYGRQSVTQDRELEDPSDDPANAMITLLEFHETYGDYLIGKVIPDIRGGTPQEDLIFQAPVPSPYKRCQIVHWSPNFEDDEEWGYGMGEQAGKAADVRDIMLRQALRLGMTLSNPALLANRNVKIPVEHLRSPAGKVIPTEGGENDVKWLAQPSRTDFAMINAQILGSLADETMGESEQRRGTPSSGSATSAAIAEQGSQSDDVIVLSTFLAAVAEITELKIRIFRVHVTKAMLVPVIAGRASKFMELTPEHLDDKVELLVQVGDAPFGTNPTLMGQTLTSLVQSIPPEILNLPEIAIRQARLAGIPDPESLVAPGLERPVSPQDENMMLMNGQTPTLNQLDQHDLHIATHTALASQMIQQAPELLPNIQFHIMEHQAMLAQQQPATPGAPGVQGTRPVTTGPGQPASVGNRLAGLNDQRQAPNTAANGAPPGPVGAPGRDVGQFSQGPQR